MSPNPGERSLVVHLFAPLTGPQAGEAVDQLRGLWCGCADSLEMGEAIPEVGVPADPPASWPGSFGGVVPVAEPVAARGRRGDGLRQAMWVRDHDVACVSIAMSRPGAGWAQLHRDWSDATAGLPMSALLGVVEEYIGSVDGPVTAGPEVGTAFAAELPLPVMNDDDVDLGWPHRGVVTREGFAIWQTTRRDAGRWLRRLVVGGDAGRDPWLSVFAWNPGFKQPALAVLTRYLLDAARIAYAVRIWQGAGRHWELRRHADASVDVLRDALGALTRGKADPWVRDQAFRHLAALRLIEAGLVEAGSLLTQVRDSVGSWTDNMVAYTNQFLDDDEGRDGSDPFAADRRITAWFDTQLGRDVRMVDATRERVRPYVELAETRLLGSAIGHHESGRRPPEAVGESSEAVAVIALTAIQEERLAVLSHLVDVAQRRHPAGTVFHIGRLPGQKERIAVGVLGAGNLSAAALTERAIVMFRPGTVVFVGIAGALHDDLALGDVVVATWIYAYHSGTEQRGQFVPRPRAWPAAHDLVQMARQVAATLSWGESAQTSAGRPPRVCFRPIAAGEVVIDDRDTPAASQIRTHFGDAAAVEMESAGAAEAAFLNGSVPILTIRGISDLAGGEKQVTDSAGWQHAAAANAAEFALALIAALHLEGTA